MHRIEVSTKPNGFGRTWLEVGNFETDEFGRQNWVKKNIPRQDRNLKIDRRHSDRGETIDWILMIPDDYNLTLVKVKRFMHFKLNQTKSANLSNKHAK